MSAIKRHLFHPASSRLARLLATTSLTQFQITMIAFVVALVAAWLFSATQYAGLFFGAILAYLSAALHIAADEIGHLKQDALNEDNKRFNANIYFYSELFLIAGLCAHSVISSPRIISLIITVLAAAGILLLERAKHDHSHELLKNIEFIRSSEIRVLILAVCALVNIPLIGLLIIAVCANALVIAPMLGLKH